MTRKKERVGMDRKGQSSIPTDANVCIEEVFNELVQCLKRLEVAADGCADLHAGSGQVKSLQQLALRDGGELPDWQVQRFRIVAGDDDDLDQPRSIAFSPRPRQGRGWGWGGAVASSAVEGECGPQQVVGGPAEVPEGVPVEGLRGAAPRHVLHADWVSSAAEEGRGGQHAAFEEKVQQLEQEGLLLTRRALLGEEVQHARDALTAEGVRSVLQQHRGEQGEHVVVEGVEGVVRLPRSEEVRGLSSRGPRVASHRLARLRKKS